MLTTQTVLFSLLVDYKRIIKRCLPPDEYAEQMVSLSLKRAYLKHANEITLYHTAHTALEKLEEHINASQPTLGAAYSGIDEFYHHMQKLLGEYQLLENKVVRTHHLASNALINIIQSLSLPLEQAQARTALEKHINILTQYGDTKQLTQLVTVLNANLEQNPELLAPLLKRISLNQANRQSTPSITATA